jgi:hypothetical protein
MTYIPSKDGIQFGTSHVTGTEKMLIKENGNIGINTTSPTQKLTVNGVAKATKLELDESSSSTGDVGSPTGFVDVIISGSNYIIPYYTAE